MKKITTLLLILYLLLGQVSAQTTRSDSVWTHPRCLFPDKELANESKNSLPIAFVLPNIPPRIDQGDQGSCVAFATAYFKTWLEAQASGWIFSEHDFSENLTRQFSPAFIYNQLHLHGGAPGIANDDALMFIAQNGVANLRQFAYDPEDDSTKPDLGLRYRSLNFRQNEDWGFTYNEELVKTALLQHPVITSYKNPSGSYHCVCIFGYNDTINIDGKIGAWYFANSVGPNWGDNGCGWLSYSAAPTIKVFYWSSDRGNYLPEQVFKARFNLSSKYLMPPRQESFWHFLKDGDTIKTIKFRPATDEYLLSLDTAILADQIVLHSVYKLQQTNNKTFPFRSQLYNLDRYNISDSSLTALTFDTVTTQIITDSIISGTSRKYTLVSDFKAVIQVKSAGSEEYVNHNDFQFLASPNPSYSQTNLIFSLKKESLVSLVVVDINGRVVVNLISGQKMTPGSKTINFAANLPTGMYIVRLTVDQEMRNLKLILLQ